MAKFHGAIGYAHAEETAPGVFSEVYKEYTYSGDVVRDSRNVGSSGQVNDNLAISNQFSLVGNWMAYENFQFMRYIVYMGAKWKITNVEIRRPRLLITVGGIFNAQVPA
jgi:hypothetical protein